MNVYITQGKCRNITMVWAANTFGICYLSYRNERTTCCIKLHTLNVIHSLYFWHILYFFFSPRCFDFCLDWNGQNCRQNKTQKLFENFSFSPEDHYTIMMPLMTHLRPNPIFSSWAITEHKAGPSLECWFTCEATQIWTHSEKFFYFLFFNKCPFSPTSTCNEF